MKVCPECNMVYRDETLNFCLDDGAVLVRSSEESATAILPGEMPTSILNRPTGEQAAGNDGRRTNRSLMFAGLAALLIAIVGAAGYAFYRYSSSSANRAFDTIAVMPFANATGNPDLEYLSDGLTDALIGSLGKIPNLNVKSRASVFRYKDHAADPRLVGRELAVPAILNGRVVQRGDDIALHLELVDTATENSIWQNTYNRRMTDLVAMQSEVARDVARKLGARLSGADEDKLTRGYTADPEAYQLYMRGRFHTLRVTRAELLKAIPFFQKAIELDPVYAMAYVGLADAYRGLPLAGELHPQEYFPKAKAAAQRAVELDGQLAEAHAVLGWIIYWYDWDWAEAERHCRRALELNPDSSDAHMALAHILSSTGRHDEAIAVARRGREIDPLNIRSSALEVQFLTYAGRTDEAIERANRVLELDPNYWFAYQFLASALIDKGRLEEAIAASEKGVTIYPENTRNASFLTYALARAGRVSEARNQVETMTSAKQKQFVPPYSLAMARLGLGERDEAIRWLQRGIAERDPRMVFLFCERKFEPLRGDPAFDAILRRMRFID